MKKNSCRAMIAGLRNLCLIYLKALRWELFKNRSATAQDWGGNYKWLKLAAEACREFLRHREGAVWEDARFHIGMARDYLNRASWILADESVDSTKRITGSEYWLENALRVLDDWLSENPSPEGEQAPNEETLKFMREEVDDDFRGDLEVAFIEWEDVDGRINWALSEKNRDIMFNAEEGEDQQCQLCMDQRLSFLLSLMGVYLGAFSSTKDLQDAKKKLKICYDRHVAAVGFGLEIDLKASIERRVNVLKAFVEGDVLALFNRALVEEALPPDPKFSGV